MSLRCLGIDGGTHPGYCGREGSTFWLLRSPPIGVEFDVAAIEDQFATRSGFVSRDRNGQAWVAKKQKFWEDVRLVSVRGKARAFAKGLK